jgi:hypothetical protein
MSNINLPKKIFVYKKDEYDFEWLSAEETAEACAGKNEKRLVGIYELKEMISVSLDVKTDMQIEKVA